MGAQPPVGVDQKTSGKMSWHRPDDKQQKQEQRNLLVVLGEPDKEVLSLRRLPEKEKTERYKTGWNASHPQDQRKVEHAPPGARRPELLPFRLRRLFRHRHPPMAVGELVCHNGGAFGSMLKKKFLKRER
jgi:hypothetical protein